MKVNLEPGNEALRLWFMIHRTPEMLKMCEDRVFREYKLTTEQYVVLVTIKYLDGPVRPTDVARWLGRSPNSISMMVDRMVKAGLLRRLRDRRDRREVRLVITSKGETALKPATSAGWDFIQKILSQVSYDDRHTLMRLLDTLQYEAATYLNPRADIEEIRRNDAKSHDNLMERLVQYISLSTPDAKRRRAEKRKTIG
jgi:DNA-binding MarR family transcriptional regulator